METSGGQSLVSEHWRSGEVGKLVALSSEGMRSGYFLCAHVKDDIWLVHKGSYKDAGNVDEVHPFQEKDLETKDISMFN